MSTATFNAQLQQTRIEAQRLLRRAQPPVVVSGGTLAFAAFVLFTASVAGGFALRAWQMAI
jgi:hypothetical protein